MSSEELRGAVRMVMLEQDVDTIIRRQLREGLQRVLGLAEEAVIKRMGEAEQYFSELSEEVRQEQETERFAERVRNFRVVLQPGTEQECVVDEESLRRALREALAGWDLFEVTIGELRPRLEAHLGLPNGGLNVGPDLEPVVCAILQEEVERDYNARWRCWLFDAASSSEQCRACVRVLRARSCPCSRSARCDLVPGPTSVACTRVNCTMGGGSWKEVSRI